MSTDAVSADNKNSKNTVRPYKEYCQWGAFNASCDSGHVILMEHAHYGRMQVGTCLTTDFKIGCYADILLSTDSLCSGRRHCKIDIPDGELHQQSPCPPDMMTYLEASYSCVPVVQASKKTCVGSVYPIEPVQDIGYIANTIESPDAIGSASCPWLIQVLPGQKINLTLIDFMVAHRYKTGAAHANKETGERYCQVYAMVRDGSVDRETAVCGSSYRETVVYTSRSNSLEISIMTANIPKPPHFLLKYQAIGCPDLEAPAGAWFSRDMERGVVKCNYTSQTWHLVCRDNEWVGTFSNCTLESASELGVDEDMPTYGLVAAVIIGCLLGIFLGMCLLGIVLLCRKRRKKNPKYFVDHRGPDATYHHGVYSKDEPDMVPQSPNSGAPGTTSIPAPEHSHYTHVWELRSAPKRQPDVANTGTMKKLAGIHQERPFPIRGLLPSSHRGDHIYESPKFERCPNCPHPTLPRDPRDPAFLHAQQHMEQMHRIAVAHKHPQSPSTVTSHCLPPATGHVITNPTPLKSEEIENTSDDSDDEINNHHPSCEVRFSKGVGYRPVPAICQDNQPPSKNKK